MILRQEDMTEEYLKMRYPRIHMGFEKRYEQRRMGVCGKESL